MSLPSGETAGDESFPKEVMVGISKGSCGFALKSSPHSNEIAFAVVFAFSSHDNIMERLPIKHQEGMK